MNDRWLVSVLTPIHNTPMDLVKRAFDSLLTQGIPFSKIQWVVVLHNCSDSCVREIDKLLGAYPNVTCRAACEEGTRVSYARNRCLDYAEGRYLFFLDSDDALLPGTIAAVTGEMEDTGAEIGVFAAEVQVSSRRYDMWVDGDPGRGSLFLDSDKQAKAQSMCMSELFLWNRCYRRAFLLEHALSFDEAYTLGEDFRFNLDATAAAGRIVLLPQIRGYRYYQGLGMSYRLPEDASFQKEMAERNQKAGHTLKPEEAMAEYAVTLYKEGTAKGLLMDAMLWPFLLQHIRVMRLLRVSEAARARVSEILKPVLVRMKVPAMLYGRRQADMNRLCAFITKYHGLDEPEPRKQFTCGERANAMEQWKNIWNGMSKDSTMHRLLDRTRQCEGTAIDVCGETLDYQQLHERSDMAAAWFQSQGLQRGEIVILSMRASVDLFCMMAAVIKAGLIVTVTEDVIPEARLRELYAQTKATLRITDGDVARIYAEGRRLAYRNITDTVSPDDVYAIWYTSGTTGEPCGIQTTARNTVLNIIPEPGNEILCGCLKESSALINISHPSFGLGFTNFFYALFYGIKFVHVQSGLENTIRAIAEKIRQNKGCFLLVPPSVMTACMQDEAAKASLASCSAVLMGADTVSRTLIQTVQEAMGPAGKVINLYGISDVGLVAAKLAKADDRPHAIGKPTAYTHFLVVDEDRAPLPQGEQGEFCITGIRVGPGYLKATGNKANRFVHREDGQRFFYTGDYGYIGEDGEVYLLGRTDRRIKHLGFRIDAAEVEEVIRRKAQARNAAVKQFIDGEKQILCAFYESDEPLDADEMRSRVAEALPRYCIPERFIHMKALPQTERGKLDYQALVLSETERDGRVREAPVTENEKAICAAFESVLHIPQVSRHDSFFELGGDSLSGMRILALLGEKYDLHYTIADLFLNPKPAQLGAISNPSQPDANCQRTTAPEGNPISLPPEIEEIKIREDLEAVYPLDYVGTLFAFMEETSSAYVRSVLYFNYRADLKCALSEDEIRKRAHAVSARHPALRAYSVKDHQGKRWQIIRKEMDPTVWYRDIRFMGENARERFFSGFFRAMDAEKASFQVGCFQTGEDSCTLLVRLMHTQADGISSVIVLNELAGGIRKAEEDAFHEFRQKQLENRSSFPEVIREYYRELRDSCRLPVTLQERVEETDVRRIVLTKQQTERLRQLCAQKGLTLAGYTEYCFGRGLLEVLQRKTVWFSHTFSRREEFFGEDDGIVGNIAAFMPVRLREGMSASEFQKELLIPWKYPYITETEEYKALVRHSIEGGVVSRIFPPFHENIVSFRDYPITFGQGLYLELKEGRLEVILRYPAGNEEKRNLDILEDTISKLLLSESL